MAATNELLLASHVQRFVTMFLMCLDPTNRSFTYAAAGQRAFLLRADGNVELLASTGPILGLLANVSISESEQTELQLGDRVFIPTDGFEESMRANQEILGKDRMLAALPSIDGMLAVEQIEALYQTSRDFSGDDAQHDDMTAIIAQVI